MEEEEEEKEDRERKKPKHFTTETSFILYPSGRQSLSPPTSIVLAL